MAHDLIRAVVARGRTVHLPNPESEPQRVDPLFANPAVPLLADPASRPHPGFRRFGPGATVELPADEAARLTRAGFLVGPPRQLAEPRYDPIAKRTFRPC
jgi:hypothetical protein